MRLYDFEPAPNPRRVRVFLAEKGIRVPTTQIDLSKGEQKAADFLKKNSSGRIPVLELDDGTCIAESISICRYFEAIQPEPNLFGRDPKELARIDMHQRQLEFDLLGPIGVSWRNGPIFSRLFAREPNVAAKVESDSLTHAFYRKLNEQIEGKQYIAGDRFTVADITAMVVIDFATNYVELKPDAALMHLWRWHREVSARPSAKA